MPKTFFFPFISADSSVFDVYHSNHQHGSVRERAQFTLKFPLRCFPHYKTSLKMILNTGAHRCNNLKFEDFKMFVLTSFWSLIFSSPLPAWGLSDTNFFWISNEQVTFCFHRICFYDSQRDMCILKSCFNTTAFQTEQVSIFLCVYLHPPGSQTDKSDWYCWSSCSSLPQFWPPGKKHETTSSPQRGASRGSLALSWVARSAFRPHTPSGRWCGLAFWSSCSDSTPAHLDYRSCDLAEEQTIVSSTPAGESNSYF